MVTSPHHLPAPNPCACHDSSVQASLPLHQREGWGEEEIKQETTKEKQPQLDTICIS